MRPLFPFFLLFVAAGFAGCRNDANEAGGAGPFKKAATASRTGDFYKRYSGTISGKPVVMHLHRMGTHVAGSYYYVASGIPIGLFDWSGGGQADDVFELTEYDASAPVLDQSNYPRLRILVKGNEASGTWISGDSSRTADLILREDYPAGSINLAVVQLQDSARMFPTKEMPAAHASYGTVVPAGAETETRTWLDNELRKVFGESAATGLSWSQVFRQTADKYFAHYRALAAGLDSNDQAVMSSSMHNHSTENRLLVLVNNMDWLVLQNAWSEYTGGAHGMHGSFFLNLDLQRQRRYRLLDVLVDTAGLAPFLTSAAVTRFGLAPGEPLSNRLLVDAIPVTENFYLTPTGLGFVYNPYEIASYADGEVHLFVPYKRLGLLLTEDFKQRMGVSSSGTARS